MKKGELLLLLVRPAVNGLGLFMEASARLV